MPNQEATHIQLGNKIIALSMIKTIELLTARTDEFNEEDEDSDYEHWFDRIIIQYVDKTKTVITSKSRPIQEVYDELLRYWCKTTLIIPIIKL